jgi:hypothetical protein
LYWLVVEDFVLDFNSQRKAANRTLAFGPLTRVDAEVAFTSASDPKQESSKALT